MNLYHVTDFNPYFPFTVHCFYIKISYSFRGVARGGVLRCPWPPLCRPSFEQTTYKIQVAKTPWQYLGRKSHCWKAHFFKICFFVKYFRQRLLSLVNTGLHAAIIRLSPLIHEGEQRYKPHKVGDPRMVSQSVTPSLKNPGYAPEFYASFNHRNRSNLSLSAYFLFWEILNLSLTFAVCGKRES